MKTALFPIIDKAISDYCTFPKLRYELQQLNLKGEVDILAIGKSAYPMAKAATEVLEAKQLKYSGYLLTKYGFAPEPIQYLTLKEAGHPTPDANSILHSKEILSWLRGLDSQATLLVLLSGGGSALFEVPANGITLQTLIKINHQLLLSGESIAKINEQRSLYSQVKTGKALAAVSCKHIYCYALSDVEGNNPEVIASGCFFNSQDLRSDYRVIGDNFSLRKQIATYISAPVTIYEQFISAQAELFAEELAAFAMRQTSSGIHFFGGEAPVKVVGKGKGGRCSHLALAFASLINGKQNLALYTLASDGNDFLEGISGAFVDGNTINQLHDKKIDAKQAIMNNDSYTALNAIGALLPPLTNPVNVNDIYCLVIS